MVVSGTGRNAAAAGPLRRMLDEIRAGAREGRPLDVPGLAARLGVAPDEAASMLDFWVARGVLAREDVTGGCPAAGCGGCALRRSCAPASGGGTRTAGPILRTIRLRDGLARRRTTER